ncbi:MAG: GDP-L-fucose synthase [Candidatus Methylacidiphilales bacterium]|nr:GDP-L-fucose synthase [Candidatus Methylacidiphilales bacterium]
MSYSLEKKRVLVTGAKGFVGRNLVPRLAASGCELITPGRKDYDLLEQDQVRALFRDTRPQVVFHLAAYVGGILANRDYPADFCYRNMALAAHPLHEAWKSGVEKFVGLMGGCSYPATAPSPIREDQLWNGYPQPESAPYSLAKAMGHELAKAYRRQYGFDAIVLVPGNIYGPWDNFDLNASHVIPALIRKYVEARESGTNEITAWGTGAPKRDFVYIEDVCRAVVHAAQVYSGPEIINISSGTRVTIRELVELISNLAGYQGKILWDSTKPDGQMDKGFDVGRMRDILGFECTTPLREGLEKTFAWFTQNRKAALRLS